MMWGNSGPTQIIVVRCLLCPFPPGPLCCSLSLAWRPPEWLRRLVLVWQEGQLLDEGIMEDFFESCEKH